jgi:hypothetical protein
VPGFGCDVQLCAVCAAFFKIFLFPHKGARRCTQVHIGAHRRHIRSENVQLCAAYVEGVAQQDQDYDYDSD